MSGNAAEVMVEVRTKNPKSIPVLNSCSKRAAGDKEKVWLEEPLARTAGLSLGLSSDRFHQEQLRSR